MTKSNDPKYNSALYRVLPTLGKGFRYFNDFELGQVGSSEFERKLSEKFFQT